MQQSLRCWTRPVRRLGLHERSDRVTTHFSCLVCGSTRFEKVEEYGGLPRVTSDCKPFRPGGSLVVCGECSAIQKLPDHKWFAEIARIYDEYEIYQLSDGIEQLIFTSTGAVPRSQRLIGHIRNTAPLPESGRLIDIGCGNGAALANYSSAFPGWQLYGSELSERAIDGLRNIPNFVELYTVPIGDIPGRFDLVSMIHSLEHMTSPRSALEQASRLLTGDGLLFVEVPDAETSPFDLLVADHLVHFSRLTLGYLAAQIGVSPLFMGNSVLPKEITMIARRGFSKGAVSPRGEVGRIAHDTVRWLCEVLDLARGLAKTQPIGIFGTSISGMWLFGALRGAVSFFVDEDPSRIGREYAGKPILSPRDAPRGTTIFIPLIPDVANQVAERYSDAPAQFIPTPPYRR
jgi:SAM-dependent methyltransferase